jgi:hypothetical protein
MPRDAKAQFGDDCDAALLGTLGSAGHIRWRGRVTAEQIGSQGIFVVGTDGRQGADSRLG